MTQSGNWPAAQSGGSLFANKPIFTLTPNSEEVNLAVPFVKIILKLSKIALKNYNVLPIPKEAIRFFDLLFRTTYNFGELEHV